MLLFNFLLITYSYVESFQHNLTAVRRYLPYETTGN